MTMLKKNVYYQWKVETARAFQPMFIFEKVVDIIEKIYAHKNKDGWLNILQGSKIRFIGTWKTCEHLEGVRDSVHSEFDS